jgi:hypothetical protein
MTNYTDFTSYNNPYGIDWNQINMEADANDEVLMDIENEDGTMSQNPLWAEFEFTETGLAPIESGKAGVPSQIHGVSEDVLGSLDAVIQFHAQWIDGKWKSTGEPIEAEQINWKSLSEDVLVATNHLTSIVPEDWTLSDVKLADAALDLLKLFGQKRLGTEQFEFKVTSLAKALIDALKKRVG